MQDPLYILRKAFYEALNEQLTYNSVDVPVYSGGLPIDAPSVYVLLHTATDTGTNTLTSFKSDSTIIVDIVSKTGATSSYDIVDNIANQVFLLLKPTINTSGLPPQEGFQIGCLTKRSDNYLPTTISGETITRRLIRFSTKINQ